MSARAKTAHGVKANERVLLIGKNTSGKSVLARYLFSQMTGVRRTIIDPKDEERWPGVEPVSDPDALDLSAPVSHFVPADLTNADELYEAVFARLWAPRSPRLILIHEATGITRSNYSPPSLNLILQQGPQKGYGVYACNQRPVGIAGALRSETEHVFVFVPRPTKRDLDTLAPDLGVERDVLVSELDRLLEDYGDYAHLWYRRATGELVRCAPLDRSWAR